ncbi:glycosyltransferase involved in cell wall biosynthesis [Metabacillus crassostreae]|uniref:glycosyltransferase n=1 Tax=Metabacillus crassostreae TaxID=929098 RepID=UPI001EF8FFF8|nr:glycosyltransferase [Metabacillus crassostreae]MBM7603169.1 glycosyltransferase involved in cell wall biosynthesis [Metabacillus crassostreae]
MFIYLIRLEVLRINKVSIIIPFYNCSYVDQAIQSALNQSYPNIEVIVVSDGSTKFIEKITPFLGSVRFIEKENGGTASALNLGIQNATGDYFSWLSSDDLYYEGKISKQLNFMKKTNGFFSYTNYSLIDNNSQIIHKEAGVFFKKKIEFLQNFIIGNNINGCTVMMKKELFSTLGLFNEKLKFTQDYDFWLRAIQHYEFLYLDEPLVKYRVHDDMGTKNNTEEINNEIKSLNQKYEQSLIKLINLERKKL